MRWELSKEMLDVLLLIQDNCHKCDTCNGCPLADLDDFYLCKLGNRDGGVPAYWKLEGLEVE